MKYSKTIPTEPGMHPVRWVAGESPGEHGTRWYEYGVAAIDDDLVLPSSSISVVRESNFHRTEYPYPGDLEWGPRIEFDESVSQSDNWCDHRSVDSAGSPIDCRCPECNSDGLIRFDNCAKISPSTLQKLAAILLRMADANGLELTDDDRVDLLTMGEEA